MGKHVEACEREWHAGRFYKLRAVYSEHERYGSQLDIHQIRVVKETDREDGFDEAQLVESSRHDLSQLFTELRTLTAQHVADEPLRNLVLAVLDRHAPALMRLPATRDRAYPYRGTEHRYDLVAS